MKYPVVAADACGLFWPRSWASDLKDWPEGIARWQCGRLRLNIGHRLGERRQGDGLPCIAGSVDNKRDEPRQLAARGEQLGSESY